MSRAIVVGVDGSGCSNCAVARAIELASGLGDTLVVAYAIEPPFRLVGEERGESMRALQELGQPFLDRAVERAGEAGVEVDALFVPKKPADALIGLAEERGARMIVVGSSSERPLAGAILGSVPHKLVHRSPVPVLVVPPDA